MDDAILSGLVRIGTVTAASGRTVRVKFQDTGMISGWLTVLHRGDYWMPSVNTTVLTLYLPVFNGDGFVLGAM